MAVTLKDIAERVGVTPATVSMVLNNKPNIGKETREKVLKVAKELNYYPHAIARGLATKRTFAIGIVVPNLAYHFVPQVLLGIEESVRTYDYNICVFDTLGNSEAETQIYRRMVREKRVDGTIIVRLDVADENLQEFVREDIPCVVVEKNTDLSSCIFTDNMKASREATSYLIDKGYRSVALVNAGQAWPVFEERAEGYHVALREAGIPQALAYACSTRETEVEGGKEVARRILSAKPRPNAILCAAGDMVAAGLTRQLRSEGLSIPDDIAVVGFGDLPVASITEPPLTTVGQPFFEMGQQSVQILFRRLQGDRRALDKKVLPSQLVIRESA